MLVKEYRISVPYVDVEKGNIGQLYTMNAMSTENSGGGEGENDQLPELAGS